MAAPIKGERFIGIIPGATDSPFVMSGNANPSSSPGVAAPEGSLYMRSVAGAGQLWSKSGAGDTDWVQVIGGGGGGGAASELEGGNVYTCPLGAAVHDVVYLSGPDSVDLADADDPLKQPVIGLISSKPTSTTAEVHYYGDLGGFSGLLQGKTYFLSTSPGQITTISPEVPGSISQKIGFARNATTLVVFVDRDFVVN